MPVAVRQQTGRSQNVKVIDSITVESLGQHYTQTSTDTTYQRTLRNTYCFISPGSICVLLFVIIPSHRLSTYGRRAFAIAGPTTWNSLPTTFVMWRTAPLHLDDYLKLICFLSTSVYSALGVSAIMRYINRRFTYFYLHLVTWTLLHSGNNFRYLTNSHLQQLVWTTCRPGFSVSANFHHARPL